MRSRSVLKSSAWLLPVLLVAGCGQSVREDRTIEFSRDGGQVAFEHGDEGIYVADADGTSVTKIFQPDEKVIATSRPLASPSGKQFLFATAEPLDGTPPRLPGLSTPTPADGRIVGPTPVRFTCWLRDEPQPDQKTEPRKLFTATCGHVGYVSAGLVVRWHPDGNRVLYVAALDGSRQKHSVFEYDLRTSQSRRVFPHAGKAVLCDWTPRGTQLVCMLGSTANRKEQTLTGSSGIWIGTPGDDASWWRVPESEWAPSGELPSVIERLRAGRPAWTPDETRFVFVSRRPDEKQEANDTSVRHRLLSVEVDTRSIMTLADANGEITDLHWSPDGMRLGFVSTGERTPLRILERDGTITSLPTDRLVRRFAGFDASGERLAYVAAEPMDLPVGAKWWCVLLLPDPLSRDEVWIADASANEAGHEIFSGMRVTFPLWSPTEPRLSLWLTFSPRYRSLLSNIFNWGLRPGDPAATIDLRSGEVAWMCVTPQEELQVGHYHLLKRNYAEAWRWYERARPKLPRDEPPKNWQEFAQRIGRLENSQVFEFLCLKKLGRDDEAAAKLVEFETAVFPIAKGEPAAEVDPFLAALGPDAELLRHLVRDLYMAEVFLSVDAIDDALAVFADSHDPPGGDAGRLSKALVRSQLLLIARDYDGYLDHCTQVVAPIALRMHRAKPTQSGPNGNGFLELACGACLAPLFSSEFARGLSQDAAHRNRMAWQEHRIGLPDGAAALAADLVLRSLAFKDGDPQAAASATSRIALNSAGHQILGDRPIDEVVATWFVDFPNEPAGN